MIYEVGICAIYVPVFIYLWCKARSAEVKQDFFIRQNFLYFFAGTVILLSGVLQAIGLLVGAHRNYQLTCYFACVAITY